MMSACRTLFFALGVSVLSAQPLSAGLITFDTLSNLPARTSSSSFSAANGGSDILDGVSFPGTFAISGDLNTVTPSAGAFLMPQSGHFAGFGFEETILTTTLILQRLYLGTTSLNSMEDGVSALTIEARDVNEEVLGSVSVTGLTLTPQLVDASAFNSLSGIHSYAFRPDSFGPNNPRFSMDDLELQAVPEPSSLALFGIGVGVLLGYGRKQKLAGASQA